ncbi:Hypothetical predicted protein [Mytilus galloprovincialis]|uniref:Uncharacterized protein n=1 Tax=Mytilus galloprovincialis TaxID=29158 RepID=A0A8B6F2M4_MYTGA|nr:Hypothetical predicted protein [Mytilus galloprovincialis]
MLSLKEFKNIDLLKGYGPPSTGMISIDRRWSFDQLEKFLIDCYPNHPLKLVGFQYAKCKQGAQRQLEIVRPLSVHHLQLEIRRGKVYLIPNLEIPYVKVNEAEEHGPKEK